MKKIVILENNGGRLANQLWQYANLYAYALEKDFLLKNYAFFRYAKYFAEGASAQERLTTINRTERIIPWKKIIYLIMAAAGKLIYGRRVITSAEAFYLPPSLNTNPQQQAILGRLENAKKTYYFCNWGFRNPAGLLKYHAAIVKQFQPLDIFNRAIQEFISGLRKKYKILVGVHIRQEDYLTWNGGIYYFSCSEVRRILDSFLAAQPRPQDIIFIICSDGKIEADAFTGLTYVTGLNQDILDLYTLAATDLLISSTSTYGQWAAYYGQINNINFQKKDIDWQNCFVYQASNNPWLNYEHHE
jgi:YHS domain-containing protein